MANITAQDVKSLREKTGAGMMDCKKALIHTDGDFEKAIDFLREKGLMQAAKKAGRVAAEGVVESYITDGGKTGAIVEVNCETDFVGKTPEFHDFVIGLAKQVVKNNPADIAALLDEPYVGDETWTVSQTLTAKIAKIGENMNIRRFARFERRGAGIIEAYIHMAGKIGVLVEVSCEKDETASNPELKAFAHNIAMHAAAARPSYMDRAEVPGADLEREREVLRAQALNEGKPEKIVDRMVEGRISKFYKDNCLLEQEYVRDPEKSVTDYIKSVSKEMNDKIEVTRFARFEMGEGLTKREDNFADEVMKQAGN